MEGHRHALDRGDDAESTDRLAFGLYDAWIIDAE